MKARVMSARHNKSRADVSERNRRTHTLIMLGLAPLYAMCFVAIRIGLPYAPPLTSDGLKDSVSF
jgi:hypothetical protein